MNGTATIQHEGNEVELWVEFPVKLSDYAIDVPSCMGITVAQDVRVSAKTKIGLPTPTGR